MAPHPGYIVTQVAGSILPCLFLWAMFGRSGHPGATVPGPHVDDVRAMLMEAVLTFGLLTTILRTASGAQNVGPLSAIGVAGYIALAGLWSSPISAASMNPVRSLGPDVMLWNFDHYWVYLAGPVIGMLTAVGLAYVIRGRGADRAAARAAQGSLGTLVLERALEHREPPPSGPTPGG